MSLRDHRDTFVLLKTSVVAEAIGLFYEDPSDPLEDWKFPLTRYVYWPLATTDRFYTTAVVVASGSLVRKLQNAWFFFSCFICELSSWGYHTQTDNIIAPKKCAPWGLSLTATTCIYGKRGIGLGRSTPNFLYKSKKLK